MYKQLDSDITIKDGMFEWLHGLLNIERKDAIMVTHDERKALDAPFGYFNKDGFHPSLLGAKLWCDRVLIPFLNNT